MQQHRFKMIASSYAFFIKDNKGPYSIIQYFTSMSHKVTS